HGQLDAAEQADGRHQARPPIPPPPPHPPPEQEKDHQAGGAGDNTAELGGQLAGPDRKAGEAVPPQRGHLPPRGVGFPAGGRAPWRPPIRLIMPGMKRCCSGIPRNTASTFRLISRKSPVSRGIFTSESDAMRR